MFKLTAHHFAAPGELPPAVDETLLLDYLVGSNGTFARGSRPGLEVCLPVSFNLQPVRGLSKVTPYAQWGYPLVPAALVGTMLAVSKGVCAVRPREALFHLSFDPAGDCAGHLACAGGWHVEMPEQRATADSVAPFATGAGTSTARALIELHSHHSMRAEFSRTDDEDEAQGFRVYAVLGTIFDRPTLRARVGLFGHFQETRAAEFFELPDGLVCAVTETISR